jgi:hypothetical protein
MFVHFVSLNISTSRDTFDLPGNTPVEKHCYRQLTGFIHMRRKQFQTNL